MNTKAVIHRSYARNQSLPFIWGTHDCLNFCAECAIDMGLTDPIVHLRGRYSSEVHASRVMIKHGWRTLHDLASSLWPTIPVAKAQTGDWAYVVNADGTEALGVVVGHQIAARSQNGMGFVLLTKASFAYRVS